LNVTNVKVLSKKKINVLGFFYAFLVRMTACTLHINTQYMTNSTLVSPVKMEYVTKNNVFGPKMMMKSGLEKFILKFLHAQAIFF